MSPVVPVSTIQPPPPPKSRDSKDQELYRWLYEIYRRLQQAGLLDWDALNTDASYIADIGGGDEVMAHIAAIENVHGTIGEVVGEQNDQTLTNKTVNADLNDFTNFDHGFEVNNPSSNVHGADGEVIGENNAQTLNNKIVPDLQFVLTGPTRTPTEGLMFWDPVAKTISIKLAGADVTLSVGQEMYTRAKNDSGVQINNGQAVYISGASGSNPLAKLAKADSATTSNIVAVATEDVPASQHGYFTTIGIVRDIDTSAFSEGDMLFLSETTAGALTATAPAFPNYIVKAATVLHSHATEGLILVSIGIAETVRAMFADLGAALAKFGAIGTNYSEFEADGTLKFNGDASVWEDENFGGAITSIGASAPTLANWDTSSIQVPTFTTAVTKELNLLKETSHSIKIGSTITFHAHVMPTTTGAGTMKFYLEYYIKVDNVAATTATTSAEIATNGVAWEELRLDFPTITNANFGPGCQVGARLYRLNTDPGTYAGAVAISTWGFHYEKDTVGSRTITVK